MPDINIVGKGFDRITHVYDTIAYIFSFNNINKSQLAFLSKLSMQKSCLILGGGTGYFLQKVLEQNDTIHITYVDASVKMIEYAKERIQKKMPQAFHRITFICKSVEDFDWKMYDVIICNYFLDLFDDAYVKILAARFKQQLNQQGLLYVTDFHISETNVLLKWSTQAGLKILYTAFCVVTKMRTEKLPAIQNNLQEQGFSVICSKHYLKGILQCSIFKII